MQLSILKLHRKLEKYFCCIQKGMLIYDIFYFIYLQANSFIFFLLIHIFFFSKMPKKSKIPESFKIHIQREKIKWQRMQRVANVELDDTLDHHIWNVLDTMQYKVIFGDCANIANMVPKKEYSLVNYLWLWALYLRIIQ